jgi:hypothetical protein
VPSAEGHHLDVPAIRRQLDLSISIRAEHLHVSRGVACEHGWRRVAEAVVTPAAHQRNRRFQGVEEGVRARGRAAVVRRFEHAERCRRNAGEELALDLGADIARQ